VSGRDIILGKIRRGLAVTGQEPRRNATVDDRLRRAPKGIVPARGQLPPEERTALFIAMAVKASASVARIDEATAVPEAVSAFLRAHNLPARLRMGDDPFLVTLPWERTQITVARGAAEDDDTVGLSHAYGAAAESGTLVLASTSCRRRMWSC
jgi:L-lactate dehydrogenase complex protein LldG